MIPRALAASAALIAFSALVGCSNPFVAAQPVATAPVAMPAGQSPAVTAASPATAQLPSWLQTLAATAQSDLSLAITWATQRHDQAALACYADIQTVITGLQQPPVGIISAYQATRDAELDAPKFIVDCKTLQIPGLPSL